MVGGKFIIVDSYYFNDDYFKLNVKFIKSKISLILENSDQFFLALVGQTAIEINDKDNQYYQKKIKNSASIPVLLYHGVIDENDGFNVLKKNFDEQMFALKKSGWQTISLEDFDEFIKGKKQLPAKSFLLTFDDGRKDSFYPVDPILRTIGYNAVIFIITGQTHEKEGKYYLSWPELKYMAKSGRWEIESHGKNDHGFVDISDNKEQGHFLTNKEWLSDQQRIETEEEFKQRIISDLSDAKSDLNK